MVSITERVPIYILMWQTWMKFAGVLIVLSVSLLALIFCDWDVLIYCSVSMVVVFTYLQTPEVSIY